MKTLMALGDTAEHKARDIFSDVKHFCLGTKLWGGGGRQLFFNLFFVLTIQTKN